MADVVTQTFQPGFRLVDGTDLNNVVDETNAGFTGVADQLNGTDTIVVKQTTADALTAHAGGGQASALLLTAAINRVSTVANANDSVKLPPSTAGASITVINGAASNSMQVFGTSPDTVNDVATGTGVAQAAGKTAIYSCPVAGKWYRLLSA